MAADFSRVRLNPLLDYAGIELKQGGVLLDADANELVAIIDRRLRALASDTLGRATVSATTPDAFKITPVAGALQIGRGRLYVDGLLAENHGAPSSDAAKRRFDDLLAEAAFTDPLLYTAQPYLPLPPALPTSGKHLVYLDVWDREVTHIETPALVETAVGVETSSRLQTVWQVRVLADEMSGTASCASPDADIAGWPAVIAPTSGHLSTGTFDIAPSTDPCELPPTGGYRGLENQLYRVQIHDGGLPGPGGATFIWSRENASVASRVASIVSATELELDSLGRDDVLRFNTGDWVEIIDDAREFSQGPGEMRKITVTEATRRISFTPALPAAMLPPTLPPPQFPSSAFPTASNLRVRRWDHKGGVFRTDASGTPVQVQDLDALGSKGVINIPAAATTLLLESGITVRFDAPAGTRGFKPGDYWVFAARTSDASVEVLDRAPPRGIHHHYARLAIWDVAAGTATDCRHPWPPTSGGGDCGCTQCVTPESHASGQLTIQAAVDRVLTTGGTVCLQTGQYALAQPVRIAGATSLRIHGQGPATVLLAPKGAFSIEQSAAIALEDLSIIALGQQSAINVNSVLGLALRELVIAVFGNSDFNGAGIALSGLVGGVDIRDNLIIAPDGIRALDTPNNQAAAQFLLTAGLRIEDNVLWCQDRGVSLNGPVGHLGDSRLRGNQLLGCRVAGLSALGFAAAGASMRMEDNNLSVNGPGIACGVDGAWIEGNKLTAVVQGQRQPTGAGIALAVGLDATGSDQCQVLANQVRGFPDAAILVSAPARDLIIKLNIIEHCGNGIVMSDAASAGALSIENNHLRDIGAPAAAGPLADAIVGIAVLRAASATIAGNTLREIGLAPGANTQGVVGVHVFATQTVRVMGNDISAVGPLADYGHPVAGILVLPPNGQADVMHNHIERDAVPNSAGSNTAWFALLIGTPLSAAQPAGGPLAAEQFINRMGRFTTLQLDETRTLLFAGRRAFVNAAAATGPGSAVSAQSNVMAGRGAAPMVAITASADVLFNSNRSELRGGNARINVLLRTPVAIVNANRVKGGEISIQAGNANAAVAAIGNITTGPINAPLKPEMQALNLIA